MTIDEYKLGDVIELKDLPKLGVVADLFTGSVRLVKKSYTLQDSEGVTMNFALIHKSFVEDEHEESEQ